MNFNTYNTWVVTYDFRLPGLSLVEYHLQSHTVFYSPQYSTKMLCWICHPSKHCCYTRLFLVTGPAIFTMSVLLSIHWLKILYIHPHVSLIEVITREAKWHMHSCWSKVLFTWQHDSTTAIKMEWYNTIVLSLAYSHYLLAVLSCSSHEWLHDCRTS